MSTLADDARSKAVALLEESFTEEGGYAERLIAQAQVWATLSVGMRDGAEGRGVGADPEDASDSSASIFVLIGSKVDQAIAAMDEAERLLSAHMPSGDRLAGRAHSRLAQARAALAPFTSRPGKT